MFKLNRGSVTSRRHKIRTFQTKRTPKGVVVSSKKKIHPSRKTWFGEKKFSSNLVFHEGVGHFLKWLLVTLGLDSSLLSTLFKTVSFLTHVEKNRGKRKVIKIMKEMKLCVLRFLSGNPLNRETVQEIRIRKDGIPSRLYDLIDLLKRGGKEEIRFIISFLSISRTVVLKPALDLTTIVEPGKAFDIPERHLRSFLYTLSNICKRKDLRGFFVCPKFKNYHLSTKTGPLGIETSKACYEELELLPSELIDSISKLGGPVLADHMEQVLSHIEGIKQVFPLEEEKKHSSFRRISYFSDPDGKTRVIALGDYWSQTALKPVHDKVFRILECIEQDQTFDQAQGLHEIAHLSDTKKYCFDLSAFTDRFPLVLIKEMMILWWGQEIADAICNIFVGFPFDIEGQKVSYSVGNPMGFYASWGLTTLCHHFVIYWACQNLNKNWLTSKYKLLGDDIIIWDGDIALEYKKLCQYLGVNISEQKTIIGKTLFEFAKRIYFGTDQVSPISFSSWDESRKSFSGLTDLYHDLRERGVEIHSSSETWVLDNFIYISNIYSKKRKLNLVSKISKKVKFLSLFFQFRKALIGGTSLLGEALAPFPCKLHWSIEAPCRRVLFTYFSEKVKEALESFQGDMSEQIIRLFMLLGNWTPSQSSSDTKDSVPCVSVDHSEVVFSCPHSYIIGQFIEQPYMNVSKRIRETTLDPSLITSLEITELELKLIALDWVSHPKIKTYGRAQLRRRISLSGSGNSLYQNLLTKKVEIYESLVNSLPLMVIDKT
jgi:hypothetical protein